MNRREFLQVGTAAASLPFLGWKYRVSLAAYSLRKYLDLKNPTMTLEDFIKKSSEWGTDGVELTEYYFPKPITPEYVRKIKRLAAVMGQTITGTPIGNTFTLPPGDARDKQLASMKNWIDVSADIGSPAIRIFAGNTPKGSTDEQARQWAVECIQISLEHAAKRGVFLALENHGGIVATADGMLAIIKAVKHDWFGVNLDTGNFHVPDPYAELEKIASYSVTCQVKVEMSVAGKKQEADLARVVEIVRKANYRGFLTLEYEAAEDPMTAVPRYLEALRKVS